MIFTSNWELIYTLPYSGKLLREKTFADSKKWPFHKMLKPIIVGTAHPNFMEKTFMDGSKTPKFANVFSLASFLLYSIMYKNYSPTLHCNWGNDNQTLQWHIIYYFILRHSKAILFKLSRPHTLYALCNLHMLGSI